MERDGAIPHLAVDSVALTKGGTGVHVDGVHAKRRSLAAAMSCFPRTAATPCSLNSVLRCVHHVIKYK